MSAGLEIERLKENPPPQKKKKKESNLQYLFNLRNRFKAIRLREAIAAKQINLLKNTGSIRVGGIFFNVNL